MLRLFRAKLVAVEKLYLLQILGMFGLRHPACNAHAQYCHLCPARLYSKFSHFLITGTISEKKVIEHKIYVLIFSTTFVRNISNSENTCARYDQLCIWTFI